MSKRTYISLKTKLCSALCQIVRYDDKNACYVPVIPHEHAKLMTEEQVLSIFNFDHWPIRKADGGEDVHWNLTPRPIPEHRIKTAKKDAPEMAKGRSIRRANDAFVNRLLAKDRGEPKPKSRWPSRKMESRNTFRERRA